MKMKKYQLVQLKKGWQNFPAQTPLFIVDVDGSVPDLRTFDTQEKISVPWDNLATMPLERQLNRLVSFFPNSCRYAVLIADGSGIVFEFVKELVSRWTPTIAEAMDMLLYEGRTDPGLSTVLPRIVATQAFCQNEAVRIAWYLTKTPSLSDADIINKLSLLRVKAHQEPGLRPSEWVFITERLDQYRIDRSEFSAMIGDVTKSIAQFGLD